MRIAVFSDVHGNYAALSAVLDDIATRGVDATVGLGDFLSGPFDPCAVADRIMGAGYLGVRGNHDRWVTKGPDREDWVIDAWVRDSISPAQAAWLGSLPLNHVFDGELFMCHGSPGDDNTLWLDHFDKNVALSRPRVFIEAQAVGYDYPVLVCGHSHVPRTLRLADGRLVVNPGTVGLPFLIGSPDAHYAILERRNGAWSAQLFSVPYDREPAKQQAIALGYPSFAKAIDTGWATFADL